MRKPWSISICFFLLYGCAALQPEFSPLNPLPPEAVRMKAPSEVTIMTGVPPEGVHYIELGYVTVEENIWTVPNLTKEDFVEVIRRKAAQYGADAVIKFRIWGEKPHRKAEGIAIKYKD
mgnify:CR=1 FL=1